MDLRPTPEQDQLVATFRALYSKEAAPDRVRAAEATLGFDKALWERVVGIGAVEMAAPDSGATLLDLALVAEEQGRWVAPVPLIEAQVASRLLAAVGQPVPTGRIPSLALHPADGDVARLVPAGAVADDVLVLRGDALLLISPGDERTTVENLGSLPLADLPVAGARVVAEGPDAVAAHAVAIDEWLTLTAAALVGIARQALDVGVAYVKERRAWGRPIGSFQAISHRLADSATAVDGAGLLAWEAAWSAAEDRRRWPELAPLAFGFASEAARDATHRSLHFHGGYGFMLEYDVQLYYRRARAWARVFGEPRVAYLRAAERRYG